MVTLGMSIQTSSLANPRFGTTSGTHTVVRRLVWNVIPVLMVVAAVQMALLGDDGLLNIGRGRVLPTTSWEAMWNGLAEWFGIVPDEMDKVLPNKKNFPADHLFTKDDLFK